VCECYGVVGNDHTARRLLGRQGFQFDLQQGSTVLGLLRLELCLRCIGLGSLCRQLGLCRIRIGCLCAGCGHLRIGLSRLGVCLRHGGFLGPLVQAHLVALLAALGHFGFGDSLLRDLLGQGQLLLGNVGQAVDVLQALVAVGCCIGLRHRVAGVLELKLRVPGNIRAGLGAGIVRTRLGQQRGRCGHRAAGAKQERESQHDRSALKSGHDNVLCAVNRRVISGHEPAHRAGRGCLPAAHRPPLGLWLNWPWLVPVGHRPGLAPPGLMRAGNPCRPLL
jgi:hypothetical protein